MTKLSDAFPTRSGGYWGKESGASDIDARAIRNGDVGTSGELRWEALPQRAYTTREFAKARVHAGDIVLTTSGNCGNVAYIGTEPEEPTVATNFVRILRTNPETTDSRYAFQFLRTESFSSGIAPFVRGATIKNLSVEAAFASVDIPLPPLPEQCRIAAILEHADALRAKRRQVLAHLDALTQSIFTDMFKTFDWLNEFGSVIKSGPTNGMYRPASDYGDGVPILRIESFSSGEVIKSSANWKRLRADETEIRRYALEVGDLVVNRVNALSHLGKSALVAAIDEPSVYESNMMRIRIDPERACDDYVLTWLQSARTKHQILRKAKKAINQASINQTDVRSLRLPLPPLELQHRFAARVKALNDQRAAVRRALAADDVLFASLQSRAFRGEL